MDATSNPHNGVYSRKALVVMIKSESEALASAGARVGLRPPMKLPGVFSLNFGTVTKSISNNFAVAPKKRRFARNISCANIPSFAFPT